VTEHSIHRHDVRHRYQSVLPCVQHIGISADSLVQPTSPGLPGPQDLASRRLAVALAVISASQLMVVLDATIVTAALPSIRTALHFSPVNLEWTISAYTLGVTSGVQPAELGIASAVLNTAQQVGGTLGLAILVTIAADARKNELHAAPAPETPQQIRDLALAASLHGYTTAFVVAACIALAAFAVALIAARPPAPSASPTFSSIGTDKVATEVHAPGDPA
jgi:MFS family permease